jgi:hypothetical protein
MVWMKPKMSPAPRSRAPKSQALQTTPANACSAATAEIDCVKKRDPRGDETNRTENQKGNGAWLSCPIKEADIRLYLVLASKTI